MIRSWEERHCLYHSSLNSSSMAYAHIVMKATSTLKKKWRRVTLSRLLDPAQSCLCLYYDSLWADVGVIAIVMHIPPPFRHNLDQYIKERSSQIPTQNTGCPQSGKSEHSWDQNANTFRKCFSAVLRPSPSKNWSKVFLVHPRYPKTSENSASYMNHQSSIVKFTTWWKVGWPGQFCRGWFSGRPSWSHTSYWKGNNIRLKKVEKCYIFP